MCVPLLQGFVKWCTLLKRNRNRFHLLFSQNRIEHNITVFTPNYNRRGDPNHRDKCGIMNRQSGRGTFRLFCVFDAKIYRESTVSNHCEGKEIVKMIIGLGNPGSQYAKTKHNIGFMMIDELASRLNVAVTKHEFDAATGTTMVNGEKVFLVKPQTFMNTSGRAVGQLMAYYQIQPDEIMVVQDDMDMPMGQLRFRTQGSAGGHNGIKDIINVLGTKEFGRLKIGIQHPKKQKVVDWVLTPFSSTDQPLIDEGITTGANALEDWIGGSSLPDLMNKYN